MKARGWQKRLEAWAGRLQLVRFQSTKGTLGCRVTKASADFEDYVISRFAGTLKCYSHKNKASALAQDPTSFESGLTLSLYGAQFHTYQP